MLCTCDGCMRNQAVEQGHGKPASADANTLNGQGPISTIVYRAVYARLRKGCASSRAACVRLSSSSVTGTVHIHLHLHIC